MRIGIVPDDGSWRSAGTSITEHTNPDGTDVVQVVKSAKRELVAPLLLGVAAGMASDEPGQAHAATRATSPTSETCVRFMKAPRCRRC